METKEKEMREKAGGIGDSGGKEGEAKLRREIRREVQGERENLTE